MENHAYDNENLQQLAYGRSTQTIDEITKILGNNSKTDKGKLMDIFMVIGHQLQDS
jgi:hypothetical protein